MDTYTFGYLRRLFSTSGTRRAALGVLLGTAVVRRSPDTVAKGKRGRTRQHRKLRNGRANAQAKGGPIVIGPERDQGIEENFIDCGTFMVHDRYDVVFTLRLFSDEDGNLVKGVEQVSGTDTFINATTLKELTGRFRNNVQIDFTTDPPLGANTGIIYKVTVPGAGAVFMDVGRLVTDQSGEIVAFQKGKHQFFDGDFTGLCSALA